MTYTVAEAERILAEAKARETAFDPLLIEAREIAASCTAYSPNGRQYREGKLDKNPLVVAAMKALRRGMELSAQPAPAPHLAAMEAAAEALEEAQDAIGELTRGDLPHRKWLKCTAAFASIRTALTQLTAQIEAARKGE